ncbi:16770_t:CDS:2, partial [Cetraspora pellucida]
FDLFVQEELLDKDVINDVKDLNYKMVDIEVFTADRKEALQQINVSFSTASDAMNSISDMMSNSNQLINDFESDFFTTLDALSSASNTISSSNQSMVMSEIELQEMKTECAQSIVEDNGINFQPLSEEYGPYFKNFTEMSLFTWIKNLEKGTLFNIVGQDIWVIAASGVITANLSQGNDLDNTKHHSANQGCRSCLAPKDKLEELVLERALQKTINEYCTKHGLSATQIVNKIILCWVAIAKASCLSFSFTFTEQTYMELDEALKIEHVLLLKVKYSQLWDTRKHLRENQGSGKDSHFQYIGQGFQKFTTDPLLQPILSDWHMAQNIQEKDMNVI